METVAPKTNEQTNKETFMIRPNAQLLLNKRIIYAVQKLQLCYKILACSV